ncbi:ABC transporter permease [Streptomyces stelliscabiei]|uniref:Transport permease protein n=1 Tax=Streptomyces stelliscabiei TaxID=146820 RepID=A0A8I0TS22_9ACTN|nr:ABC transporter permease [Streptomyces stelliscabiei]KND45670.1 multidrug ABC transporter permease [Streptomyces stelliscabiei]MBE1598132.1 ABC-type polysaccharide/polyol phosphate export permease [Streptomyces stelliscabiei]MDX2521030.1 ABC transporter permease [Streptomyces stelliscabiei]
MTTVDLGASRARGRMYWLFSDVWNIVRRGLTHYRRQPVNIAWQLGFPILSVLLYGYVFGSAMKVPGGGDYRDFLMPGMFVMTMAFGFINTATLVVHDSTKGVIDRFRSMPMAPSAVVAGRGLTDLLVACAELAIMMLTAVAMGWRPDGGLGFLAAFGLLLWLRFALIWIGVWLGLLVPNPEAAGGLFAVAFPLTMISSIYVAPQLMPDWLGWIAAWNPVSSTAAAARELFGTPVDGGESWVERNALLMAGVWPLVLTLVFLPLAVRRFRKLSS